MVRPLGKARRLLVTMQHDAEQHERCLSFWAALLRRSFDDLHSLSHGLPLPTGEGRAMSAAERAATLVEVTSWFFDFSDSPVSLSAVCDHLDLSASWMRTRAKQIIAGAQEVRLRRHRLTVGQRAVCVAMLASGDSTRTCAKYFAVDISTCRKVRLRAEADGVLKFRARFVPEKKNAANLAASGVFRA
jgi:hypothetical protein